MSKRKVAMGEEKPKRMTKRPTMVKKTVTRSRSERLNASRNKRPDIKEDEKKKETKAAVSVLSLTVSGRNKRRFSAQISRRA